MPHCWIRQNRSSGTKYNIFLEIVTRNPSIYTMDHPDFNACIFVENAIGLKWVNMVNSVSDLLQAYKPGRVAQSVTCLATDACLTADPGVASSIPARSHTFVEIDHEIISTVILLPSADSFKKGCCQLQAKVCAQITG